MGGEEGTEFIPIVFPGMKEAGRERKGDKSGDLFLAPAWKKKKKEGGRRGASSSFSTE